MAALELVVRGGSAIDLEVDGWVVQQKHALTKLQVAGKRGSTN